MNDRLLDNYIDHDSLGEFPGIVQQHTETTIKQLAEIIEFVDDPMKAIRQFQFDIGLPIGEPFSASDIAGIFAPVMDVFEHDTRIADASYHYYAQLNEQRGSPLSDEQVTVLSAILAGHDVIDYFIFRNYGISLDKVDANGDTVTHPAKGDMFKVRSHFPRPIFLGVSPLRMSQAEFQVKRYRSSDRYPRSEQETCTDMVKRVSKKGPMRLLDIGLGTGNFLWEMKESAGQTLGSDIYTVGVGLDNEIYDHHAGVDEQYIGPAELLPPEWSNSMNMVVSNEAFQYFCFPDRVLSETLRVLAPDGEAHIHLDPRPTGLIGASFAWANSVLHVSNINTVWGTFFAHFRNQEVVSELIEELAGQHGMKIQHSIENGSLHIHRVR